MKTKQFEKLMKAVSPARHTLGKLSRHEGKGPLFITDGRIALWGKGLEKMFPDTKVQTDGVPNMKLVIPQFPEDGKQTTEFYALPVKSTLNNPSVAIYTGALVGLTFPEVPGIAPDIKEDKIRLAVHYINALAEMGVSEFHWDPKGSTPIVSGKVSDDISFLLVGVVLN